MSCCTSTRATGSRLPFRSLLTFRRSQSCTVLSTSALAGLAPILEEVAGWERYRIRSFFEANGMLIQEWQRVRTDWLTVRPAADRVEIVGEASVSGLASANS